MALTKIGQLLIDYLSISKASGGTQAIAFILMDTEDQMLEMCHFLSANENATDEEILETAHRISGR